MTSSSTFSRVVAHTSQYGHSNTGNVAALVGEMLPILRSIPDAVADAVIASPPLTMGMGKRNAVAKDQLLTTVHDSSAEWNRILRRNGTVYIWCDWNSAPLFETAIRHNLHVEHRLVWISENITPSTHTHTVPHSQGNTSASSGCVLVCTSQRSYTTRMAHRSAFGEYLYACRTQAGLSGSALAEAVGAHGEVNHGGVVSNWETGRTLPTPEQYSSIVEVLLRTEKISSMLPYHDVVPAHATLMREQPSMWVSTPTIAPYGIVNTTKPYDLMVKVIQENTQVGDLIVDCFHPSGDSGIIATNLNRHAICVHPNEQVANREMWRVYSVEEERIPSLISYTVQHELREDEPPTLF